MLSPLNALLPFFLSEVWRRIYVPIFLFIVRSVRFCPSVASIVSDTACCGPRPVVYAGVLGGCLVVHSRKIIVVTSGMMFVSFRRAYFPPLRSSGEW